MSTTPRTPQANIAPFGLRMQPDLKARIEAAARKNERSMNAEIVARLEDSFTDRSSALAEAAAIAESLRANLSQRVEAYDRMLNHVQERSIRLQEMQAEILKEVDLRVQEREQVLEERYQKRMKRAEKRLREADEYAESTIARERQFIETIKALTGKEPPAVEQAARGRRGEPDPEGD